MSVNYSQKKKKYHLIKKKKVITSAGLDHTRVLGDTIEEIITHKAGIIKPGFEIQKSFIVFVSVLFYFFFLI